MKLRLIGSAILLAAAAVAATSTAWETSSSAEFLKGRLSGLALTNSGILRPGPAIVSSTTLDQPVLWDIVEAPDGGIYAATGHRGRVYLIEPGGKATTAWTAEQPEVFALCVDTHGRLYAGTSPNGGVYRIENGKGVEVAHLGTKYIWALVAAPDGAIFAGTGDDGRIYRIDPAGHAEVYYETGQSNVTALALGANGHLYAGSEPNGLLFEISAARKGSVLYDSSLPEIHSIAVAEDGTVFASALGGSLATRTTPTPQTSAAGGTTVVAGSPTTVTVSEAKESSSADTADPDANVNQKDLSKGSVTSTVTPVTAATPAFVDVTGVEKSAIYRIRPGRAAETLRSSKEENVYSLALDGDNVLFSTDVRGRVYSISQDRRVTLLAETGDSEATSLLKNSHGIVAGLSNPAKVIVLGTAAAKISSYDSPVHDTTSLARWGRLAWRATGSGLSFQTRSGNSSRPDATWSAWSGPIRDPASALISSPRARYIQWRAEWAAASDAALQSVTVPFLPQNSPPVVRSIAVTEVASANATKANAAAAAAASSYTVTVSDTGDSSAASSSGSTLQTLTNATASQVQISWQADDPDGDKLLYDLYFRGADETQWKLLREHTFDNNVLLDADSLADGRYFFRVVASDKPSNDLRYALDSELVSSPVLIDNTPPTVNAGAPTRNGQTVDVEIAAEDKTSPLRKCEFSVDAGLWQPVEADDGVTDSPREQFHVHAENLKPGEHLITIRVYDSAGNAGLAKVVVR